MLTGRLTPPDTRDPAGVLVGRLTPPDTREENKEEQILSAREAGEQAKQNREIGTGATGGGWSGQTMTALYRTNVLESTYKTSHVSPALDLTPDPFPNPSLCSGRFAGEGEKRLHRFDTAGTLAIV